MKSQLGLPPPAMGRFEQRPRQRTRRQGHTPRTWPERPAPDKRPSSFWPGLAVLALLMVTGSILLFNQQHSGDHLKIRRELRKF